MQTYEIIVSGRAVHANSADTTLVRTSIGIDKVHVLFDNEEWTAFPVRVTFANGDTIISTSLTLAEIDAPEWAAEAECAIPWEVIQDLGGIRITFQGTDASGNHIITEASGEPLSVVEAGDVGSGTVPSPAPSVDEWNQAYANAMAAANSALGASESATEAADRANTAAAEAEQILEDGIPLMDADTRGGAKLGDGLEVDENEALNAKVGGDITIDSNGAINYVLPTMSATQHGGATLGSGLRVDNGALSLGDLVQSSSGAEVLTDGCAIYGVSGEGWATQDGTPTPDNPVEIEVARGRNLLKNTATSQTVNGVTFTVAPDGIITANGKATGGDAVLYLGDYVAYPNGQYCISGVPPTGSNSTYYLRLRKNGGMDGAISNLFGGSATFTVDGSAIETVRTLIVIASGYTASNLVFRIQLELGTTPTPYVPYGCVGLEAHTRNLLQGIETGVFNQGNGSKESGNGLRSIDVIQVRPNTTYVRSGFTSAVRVFWYNASKSYFSNEVISADHPSITVPNNVWYMNIQTATGSVSNTPQIELGSTATPYQPYYHTTTPVPLPTKGFAASLPDGTADALAVDSAGRWVWESVVWTVAGGDDGVGAYYNSTNHAVSLVNQAHPYPAKNDALSMMSDSFIFDGPKGDASAGAMAVGKFGYYYTSTGATPWYIYFQPNESMASQSDVATWLNTHKPRFYYPLATPITEHGYIDLPALPKGATVSIPELEQIGCAWFVDGAKELVEHAANMARRETEENESIEDALAELAARVAALES